MTQTPAHPTNSSSPWLTVQGGVRPDIEALLRDRLEHRRASGAFSLDFQRGVEDATAAAVKSGAFQTSPRRSEMLRNLCQVYGVEVKPREISSHRKFVGPCIVYAKKLLFRMLQPLIGPSLEQQRNFNAAVIYLLIDLCNEAHNENSIR